MFPFPLRSDQQVFPQQQSKRSEKRFSDPTDSEGLNERACSKAGQTGRFGVLQVPQEAGMFSSFLTQIKFLNSSSWSVTFMTVSMVTTMFT